MIRFLTLHRLVEAKVSMKNIIGLYLTQNQIDSLKSGNKFTTCEPKQRIEKLDHQLIPSRQKSIGQIFDVADEGGKVQIKAKLVDCFITTFGKPDPKFVFEMGFGSDYQKMKSEYSKFWQDNFPSEQLNDTTELFVTMWDPIR